MLLAAALVAAVTRPRWAPEAGVAAAGALIVIAAGTLPAGPARAVAARLLPVLGFLAAVLVLGMLCERAGLFSAAGERLGQAGAGRPVRLLTGVFGLASVTTAVLSLDTTVVLLTPVVHETASRAGVPARPHMYACAHLANSASLLLPVSNLTNLLAFAASGLSLTRFAELMAAPWAAAIAVEYLVFRGFFGSELRGYLPPGQVGPAPPKQGFPAVPALVLAATLAGFVATSLAGVNPAWAALGGAVLLAARGLARREVGLTGLLRAASVPFLVFVLGLGLIVRAVVRGGLGAAVADVLPHGSSLPVLLAVAAVAAVLANLVNNLPAVLILLSVLASRGATAPGVLLAVLIGVNIGPNLSYAGSLATLLWRRLLAERDQPADLAAFTRLGLLTVPAGLALATVALWLSLRV
jgi:arsenical pump membrane protein